MVTPQTQPHGSWKSPITSSMIVESSIRLGNIVTEGDDLYWNELRPEEKGRSVIVRWRNGEQEDLLPSPYSAQTSVHEYGGGSFTVMHGELYFSNKSDQAVYVRKRDGTVDKVCDGKPARYAGFLPDKRRNILYAVQEKHLSEQEVINCLVAINTNGEVVTLHSGHDFYSMPALHPKGTHLAFLTWDFPNMPWDGTTLWVSEIAADGSLLNVKKVAGGANEAIFQPMWSQGGTLYFVSDQTGWWNLYRLIGDTVEACYPMEAEFGKPLWVFGMGTYEFLENNKIAVCYTVKGTDFLGILDPESKTLETLNLPYTSYGSLHRIDKALYFIAASPTETRTLFKYENGEIIPIRVSKEMTIDKGYLSLPETIEFPTEDGKTAFAFYYPPKNKDFIGTDKPPLLVVSHGGPTTHAAPVLGLDVQFWTSRGFGVLNVNYGGSTGYGREYRDRLKGNWGIVDVNDCVNGALYLVKQGRVDSARMAIKGGSSGGYTTLAALTFKDVFKAGASYYGICDLEALLQDTHKFESHYTDLLIGPYPAAKERYRALSPIHHIDKLSRPVILFQGSNDKIVPPNQAEMMFEALDKKKIPVAYLLFEGEEHGFRKAENIKKALDAELYFYGKIFGFSPNDSLEPITISNL